jgi:hypothetical protein
VSEKDFEVASDCAIIECPQCARSLGTVVFPNLRDTEEAAAQGYEEAIRELPEMRDTVKHAISRIERFERGKLKSIDQLPELDGAALEFTWDGEHVQGEFYQIIRLGNAEVWRELGFFDNIRRFQEIKELVKQKYLTRFKSLRPTEGSLEWLCGDQAWKLSELEYT